VPLKEGAGVDEGTGGIGQVKIKYLLKFACRPVAAPPEFKKKLTRRLIQEMAEIMMKEKTS